MDTVSDERLDRTQPQIASGPPSGRTALFAGSIAAVAVVAGVLVWQAGLLDGVTANDLPKAAATDRGANAAPAEPARAESKATLPPPCSDDMVFVAGGKFFMGSDAEAPVLKSANPAHQVEVGGFCIDRTEVTLEAYRECSDEGACKRAFRDSWWPQGSKNKEEWGADREVHSQLCNEQYEDRGMHPVNCVTWHQADAYCRHVGKTLPSEEQWEFAARRSDGRVYSWGDDKPDSERMNGCGSECVQWRAAVDAEPTPPLFEANDGYPGTAPVGSFPAGNTREGISDLAGNVFEWTADEFRPYGDVDNLAQDAAGRVIRGGAFNSFMPEFADPALRFPLVADAHSHGVGFRCAAKPSR
jgi:formylglycine-generating enzyme required for sulfatase activity